ncbi:LysE family translocator [Pendulispora brunnea]|uniref:LysE family translocator n=1 Tax=Pendulispora brunnea TaxID=2905690 RepID=A0ABZ2K524_9BACT
MAHTTWLLFFTVSLAAVLTPGPAMLTILGHALARGGKPTVPVVLGNAFGALLLMAASIAGLSGLLAALPHGLQIMKWAGAAYLFWLGLRAIRSKSAGTAPAAVRERAPFARGVFIALSNPKALLFYGAVLPQFVDGSRPVLPQFGVMAATFIGLELAMTGTVTFAAHIMAPLLRRTSFQQRSERAGGAIMMGAAALLAIAPVKAR